MSDQILQPGFRWGLLILAIGWALACVVSRVLNQQTGSRSIHLAYFSNPVSNLLAIVAIGLPALVGVTASLYKDQPGRDYSALLTSIVGLLLVIAIAFWLTFSLLSKGTNTEVVCLNLPKERYFLTSLGVIYMLMFVVFFFSVKFFLFDFSLQAVQAADRRQPATVILRRPSIALEMTRSGIERAWGEPTTYNSATRKWFYESTGSDVLLEFDKDWKLMRIEETRKRRNP